MQACLRFLRYSRLCCLGAYWLLAENPAIYLLNYSMGSKNFYYVSGQVLIYFFTMLKKWEKINPFCNVGEEFVLKYVPGLSTHLPSVYLTRFETYAVRCQLPDTHFHSLPNESSQVPMKICNSTCRTTGINVILYSS